MSTENDLKFNLMLFSYHQSTIMQGKTKYVMKDVFRTHFIFSKYGFPCLGFVQLLCWCIHSRFHKKVTTRICTKKPFCLMKRKLKFMFGLRPKSFVLISQSCFIQSKKRKANFLYFHFEDIRTMLDILF